MCVTQWSISHQGEFSSLNLFSSNREAMDYEGYLLHKLVESSEIRGRSTLTKNTVSTTTGVALLKPHDHRSARELEQGILCFCHPPFAMGPEAGSVGQRQSPWRRILLLCPTFDEWKHFQKPS